MDNRTFTARDLRRLIDVALDRAAPGTQIAVEALGIRVEVKRDAPAESTSRSPDDKALDDVKRRLGLVTRAP